jgi:hypothetical protein
MSLLIKRDRGVGLSLSNSNSSQSGARQRDAPVRLGTDFQEEASPSGVNHGILTDRY